MRFFILSVIGFLSFLFFLVRGFPAEPLKDALFATVQKESGLHISADALSFRFPSGLEMSGVSFTHPFLKEKNITLEKTLISIPLFQLFNEYPSGRVDIEEGEGNMTAELSFPSRKGKGKEQTGALLKAAFTSFPFEKISSVVSFPLTGSLSGKGELSLSSVQALSAVSGDNIVPLLEALKDGEGRFLLKEGQLTLPFLTSMGFPPLGFSRISVIAELKGTNLSLSGIEITGKDFIGRINGNIDLRSPLPASSMNITIRLKATAGADVRFTRTLSSLQLPKDPEGFSFIRFNNITFISLP